MIKDHISPNIRGHLYRMPSILFSVVNQIIDLIHEDNLHNNNRTADHAIVAMEFLIGDKLFSVATSIAFLPFIISKLILPPREGDIAMLVEDGCVGITLGQRNEGDAVECIGEDGSISAKRSPIRSMRFDLSAAVRYYLNKAVPDKAETVHELNRMPAQ